MWEQDISSVAIQSHLCKICWTLSLRYLVLWKCWFKATAFSTNPFFSGYFWSRRRPPPPSVMWFRWSLSPNSCLYEAGSQHLNGHSLRNVCCQQVCFKSTRGGYTGCPSVPMTENLLFTDIMIKYSLFRVTRETFLHIQYLHSNDLLCIGGEKSERFVTIVGAKISSKFSDIAQLCWCSVTDFFNKLCNWFNRSRIEVCFFL